MDKQQRQKFVEKIFDTVAEGYDHPSLSWFDKTAEAINQLANIQPGESVLDIACGTGKVTTALAKHQHNPTVTAVDLSAGMLEQAKLKAKQEQLNNIEFHQMAFEDMAFGERFDVVVCSFGIFFVNEMEEALVQFSKQMKPDGRIILTTFAEGSFSPFTDAFMRLYGEFGFDVPTPGWLRLCSDDHLIQLFSEAGLSKPQCQQYDFGYQITNTQQWWDIIWNAGYRGMLQAMDENQLSEFKEKHLAEVDDLIKQNNNYLNVDVIISIANK